VYHARFWHFRGLISTQKPDQARPIDKFPDRQQRVLFFSDFFCYYWNFPIGKIYAFWYNKGLSGRPHMDGEVISCLITKDKGPMSLEAVDVLWTSRGRVRVIASQKKQMKRKEVYFFD